MSILNARYIMDPSADPRAHVEIVYSNDVKYAGGTGEDGWDELQAWVSAGNTIVAYEDPRDTTPVWVASVRDS